MSDRKPRVVEFVGVDGLPIGLRADTIVAITGNDTGGCDVCSSNDVHRVKANYAEAVDAVWPDRVAP